MVIDFEAEGLLDGTEGDARSGRLKLLEELAGSGASLDELRAAVAEERLALLPVERELEGGGSRHTIEDVAERSGLGLDFFERQLRANGVSVPEPGDAVLTEADLEAATRLAALRDAGIADEQLHEMGRVIGMSMSTLAAATRRLVGESFIQPGDTEYELGHRLADVAQGLTPLMAESLEYLYRLHVRDQIRRDFISTAALESGRGFGSDEISVCFADMVGFTRLGERIEAEELGVLTGRFTELVGDNVEPPVRLVKLLGDAAMLVSPEHEPLVEAALRVVDAAEVEERMPQLRAGVSFGPALARAGDWYGRPVNLASRITDVARPGTVLGDERAKEQSGDAYEWSFAGEHRLKGIQGKVKLFRCRRNESSAERS